MSNKTDAAASQLALVTGGTKGIGLAFSRRLIKLGYHVIALHRRDPETATSATRELGSRCTTIQTDISNPDEVRRLADQVLSNHGTPHVLVNNAGRNIDKPFAELSDKDWHTVLDTNLSGPFYMARAFAPTMQKAGGGTLINIAATTGLRPRFNGLNYTASKAGLLHLTKCLALELAPTIRVNSLIPGMIDTHDMHMRVQNAPPEHRDSMYTGIPQQRIGTPEEMADALEFLISNHAQYITGQKLIIDGGQYMW